MNYIGIDLGGTNIAAGIVDEKGNLIYTDSVPTRSERDAVEIIADIAKLVEHMLTEKGISKEEIKSIGIGVPGVSDETTGNIISCVNLGWYNQPLRVPLEELLKLPVFIDNDATVAGVAEYHAGKMKGYRNGVFITLGTGVGSGIIINGKVIRGSHGVGSEVGHMIVGENFYNCNCGKNGCLETFSSATAMIKYAQHGIKEGEKSSIINEIDGNLEKITAKLIIDHAKAGDLFAESVVDRMVKYLAIGIFNITNIIDPDIFVIGGGVSKAGDYLLKKLNEVVQANKLFKDLPVGKIEIAELENDAGIIGAAMLGKM